MTRKQLKDSIGEVLGKLHWARAHREYLTQHLDFDQEKLFGLRYDTEQLLKDLKELLRRQQAREFEEERNARGNIVLRWFRSQAGRYHWDFGPCQRRFGWEQYDTKQDASYFGVWVHLQKRLVLTYCEGDVSLVICPTVELLRAELKSMEEFYGPPPPAMICADGIELVDGKFSPTGDVTAIYDTRPSI